MRLYYSVAKGYLLLLTSTQPYQLSSNRGEFVYLDQVQDSDSLYYVLDSRRSERKARRNRLSFWYSLFEGYLHVGRGKIFGGDFDKNQALFGPELLHHIEHSDQKIMVGRILTSAAVRKFCFDECFRLLESRLPSGFFCIIHSKT